MKTFSRFVILVAVLTHFENLVNGNHMFTAKMYSRYIKTTSSSFIFSPLAAETVLADVALEGADGETAEEILDAIEVPNTREAFESFTPSLYKPGTNNTKLSPAYKIYVSNKYRLNNSFVSVSKRRYNVDVGNVNFADKRRAAQEINKYVEDRSDDRIKNLISPGKVGANDGIVLVNALYQSNRWLQRFAPMKSTFFTAPNKSDNVEFLKAIGRFRIYRSSHLKADYLEIPMSNNISCILILPRDRDGIKEIEKNIFDYLAEHRYNLMKYSERVYLQIPKFSVTTDIELTPYLKDIGIEKLFDPSEAELPYVSNKKGLYVKSVPQSARVNLTEYGNDPPPTNPNDLLPPGIYYCPPRTRCLTRILPTFVFNADHPFVFYIKDLSSTLMTHVGRFNNIH